MTDINLEIARLVQYGVKKGLLHQEDAVFAVNRVLALLKLNDYTQAAAPEENLASPQPILNRIIDWAAETAFWRVILAFSGICWIRKSWLV